MSWPGTNYSTTVLESRLIVLEPSTTCLGTQFNLSWNPVLPILESTFTFSENPFYLSWNLGYIVLPPVLETSPIVLELSTTCQESSPIVMESRTTCPGIQPFRPRTQYYLSGIQSHRPRIQELPFLDSRPIVPEPCTTYPDPVLHFTCESCSAYVLNSSPTCPGIQVYLHICPCPVCPVL
jgi:hypothetical protein